MILEPELEEALANATDAEMCDIAGKKGPSGAKERAACKAPPWSLPIQGQLAANCPLLPLLQAGPNPALDQYTPKKKLQGLVLGGAAPS